MKYKAVFFDFDGTLMDTSQGVLDCGKLAMEAEGLEIKPDARWDLFIGPPLAMCFKLTFGVEDKNELEKLCLKYKDLYVSNGQYHAKFYEGIPEVLKELKSRGYLLACASLKYEELVDSMCRYFGIREYFDQILGLDIEEKHTKESLIREGCRKLGIKVDEAVLIGDTDYDKQGAGEAGCSFIPVGWGFGYKPGQPGVVGKAEDILTLV